MAAILEYEPKILEWRELREGKSKIRVIDDAEELKRLCKRKAPGADKPCNWNDKMKDLCGKVFVVQENNSEYQAYVVKPPSHTGAVKWHIPFDACRLVEY